MQLFILKCLSVVIYTHLSNIYRWVVRLIRERPATSGLNMFERNVQDFEGKLALK